jgi:hypothetical protein
MRAAMLALALSACAPARDGAGDPSRALTGNPKLATDYPEAVVVSSTLASGAAGLDCSGVLVRACVVLTVGHCVLNQAAFQIVAPFAPGGAAAASATQSIYYRAPAGDPVRRDAGLILLAQPITLDSYPQLAAPSAPARALVVGRVHDGVTASDALYRSEPFAIVDGTTAMVSGAQVILGDGTVLPLAPQDPTVASLPGYEFGVGLAPLDGLSQPGDSGGPLFVVDDQDSHILVGVNKGRIMDGTIEWAARVDALADWVDAQVLKVEGDGGPGTGCPPP